MRTETAAGSVQKVDKAPCLPLPKRSPGGRGRGSTRAVALSRSEQMARIRGSNTSPEIRLRHALWARGLRYRLHAPTPAGRPDVVFPEKRVAVFVDGCQWHGCPDHYVFPRTRREFWGEKLLTNFRRDRRQTLELEQLGWRVVRPWEHTVFIDLDGVCRVVETIIHGGHAPTGGDAWRVVAVEPLPDGADMERRHLEDLRDPMKRLAIERRRSTAKWSVHARTEQIHATAATVAKVVT
jgi:DNA mismatch endonuclease (patch repair protein)